jgi:protein ImuB
MHHEPRGRSREGDGRETRTPAAAHTPLAIALAEPSRDATHLQTLLREHLAALVLPAPTLELSLAASDIVQAAPPNSELFPTSASEREGLTRLIERLQARLGPAQVQRLHAVADHRPERATVVTALQLSGRAVAAPAPVPVQKDVAQAPPRPVWLLAVPEPLRVRQGQPLLDGQLLQLLSGPERIESGWWDGALAERDYFIAQLPSSALVWVYRSRLPQPDGELSWFLQGRFA